MTLVVHADTEAEAWAVVPPLRPGWKRQESIDLHCSCVAWPVRLMVVDTEERK